MKMGYDYNSIQRTERKYRSCDLTLPAKAWADLDLVFEVEGNYSSS